MTINVRRVLGVFFVMIGLVACSSSTTTASMATAPQTSRAPEEKRASAADVAAGLKKIDQTAKDIVAAGTDKAKTAALDGQIEPIWVTIEGTVKANTSDSYLAMEDAFAVLERAAAAGDVAASTKASADISATVSTYLAKHPG